MSEVTAHTADTFEISEKDEIKKETDSQTDNKEEIEASFTENKFDVYDERELDGLKILNDAVLLADFRKKFRIYCLKNYEGINFLNLLNYLESENYRNARGDFIFDGFEKYVDLWMQKNKVPKKTP